MLLLSCSLLLSSFALLFPSFLLNFPSIFSRRLRSFSITLAVAPPPAPSSLIISSLRVRKSDATVIGSRGGSDIGVVGPRKMPLRHSFSKRRPRIKWRRSGRRARRWHIPPRRPSSPLHHFLLDTSTLALCLKRRRQVHRKHALQHRVSSYLRCLCTCVLYDMRAPGTYV